MSFLYFAYGSNMLTQRMHLNCPSARYKCIGLLQNFKLSFASFADSWKGAPATIIESRNDAVWGVVWEILKEHEEKLNRQESDYHSFIAVIETEQFGKLNCKTYQKAKLTGDYEIPSFIYKAVFVQGAKEHGLPPQYIQQLEAIPDNGYKGSIAIPIKIDL